MIRILFFIDGIHLGGKERRLVELMKELRKRNQFDFQLAVMHPEINYQEIFQLHIKIHYLIRKKKNDWSIFLKLFKIAKKNKIDIIHCWDSMTVIYSIPICKLLKIKLVNGMVVDTPVKQNFSNKRWARAKLSFPFSNVVIGNSRAGLKAYGAPFKKSICIYNGIDLSRFKNLPKKEEIINSFFKTDQKSLFIIGMVAAFEDRKDYQTVIRAALILTRKHKQIRFLLIGQGENLNQIKKSVPQRLSQKILFPGKRSDVEALINIFDIGILSTNSLVHGEGISNSIIEYLALSKPVIATRGGGTEEIISDNENGYLIDPGNENQLVEKIEILLENKNREKIGEKGNQVVLKKFDLRNMADAYSEIYFDLKN